MRRDPWIALIGTLDTKGEEIAYVRDRLRALGARPVVIDTGILGEAGCEADVPRAEVAAAAGDDLEGIRNAGSRGAAVERMTLGVRAVCLRLLGEGRLHGALCLGGAEGALMGAGAMHALPVGVPKLIVSPSASGRRAFGPFMGETDTTVMHSVVDILGLHPISRAIFDNAAAAVAGMARDAGGAVGDLGARTVGVTMLGQTTPGVMRLRERLIEAGHEPVIFHANGVGGPAMEKLAAAGALVGRRRLHALRAGQLADGRDPRDGARPAARRRPRRAAAGGRPRLLRLLQPGRARHGARSASATARPTSTTRSRRSCGCPRTRAPSSARMIAERLAEATGPVSGGRPDARLLARRRRGRRPLGPRRRPRVHRRLRDALRADFAYEEVDAHVDDADFADVVADRYLALVGGRV